MALKIRPLKTESLAYVEIGAAIREGITASDAHDVEPRMRPVVKVDVVRAKEAYGAGPLGEIREVDIVI